MDLRVFLLVATLLLSSSVTAYKILALCPHVTKSHYAMVQALLRGLAARGHQVTVVSHFPQQQPIPNLKDISLVGSMDTSVEDEPLTDVGKGEVMKSVNTLVEVALAVCENTLSFPPIQRLMKSDEKFDLIITELFNTDCMLGFVHKFKVPFIALTTSVMMPWSNERFANPDNPSYIPHHFLGHSDHMSFGQRFLNAVYQEVIKWAYYGLMDMPTQKIARKYFGEGLPPLAEIARNTSLLLLNTHFTINQPRPLVPNIVEVGGIHLTPPKELPQDLKEFLDQSVHGVICFSFGSIARTETLPAEIREAFLHAFAELPQRVVWKWESDTLPGKPDNVKIVRWLPQVDVLRHPNVRAFLTHGGLMGTIEAIHSGVPMVGIPLFGDQEANIASYVSEGIAIKIAFQNITKQSVLEALKTVLNDPSYRENALRISKAFNDRPLSPLDTAIFWTEYVIRHGGAPHIRSAALDLAWYQYLLLDVLAVVVSAILIVVVTTFYILKLIIGCLCPRKAAIKQKRM
ncbi:UDP-glycosyltransferase UGT5-like [Periplaneta americana]|uniref:UDP-glycosyltransferase UGT5-like n=1 Tax=Periplaneta americana TaxID=6978 RepID=UPI0037E7059F